ncbi:MAG: pilus assembly protein [Alphaproteobacteria bacterium]
MNNNINTVSFQEGKASFPDAHDSPKGGKRRKMRLWRSERGATLIEFAFIMIPFFMLIFGIFEVGFVFWGIYDLENATEDAARQIRTGQVYAGGVDLDGFKSRVCSHVSVLGNCMTKIRIDVQSYDSFSQLTSPTALDGDGNLQNSFSYSPGGPGQVVLVSAFYEWPLINPMTGISLSNMANGNRLLRASVAFRNEPFPEN